MTALVFVRNIQDAAKHQKLCFCVNTKLIVRETPAVSLYLVGIYKNTIYSAQYFKLYKI